MDLSSAADELYGLPPAEFTPARKRLVAAAKADGSPALAKEIGVLRKPVVSAWAVNLLARSAGDELAGLLATGDELRAAWADGTPLGELEQRRAGQIAHLVRTARTLAEEAGQPLREGGVREVEDTLQAATIDAETAEEVRSGRLTHPRSHAGFVPTGDWTAAAAPPAYSRPRLVSPAPAQRSRKAEEEARKAEEEARRAANAARKAAEAAQALAEWETELAAAQREFAELSAEAEQLQQALDALLTRRGAAERRLAIARREHTRATRTAENARRAL